MLRTNVYVDGFNLYYGCLKGTPYKWLDLDAMCRRLLPKHELSRIRYFTAIISARPLDPSGPGVGCVLPGSAGFPFVPSSNPSRPALDPHANANNATIATVK